MLIINVWPYYIILAAADVIIVPDIESPWLVDRFTYANARRLHNGIRRYWLPQF